MFFARIRQDSVRYRDWFEVVGGDRVPILSPLPFRASAIGREYGAEFYALDIGALTAEQYSRLCGLLAVRLGYDVATIHAEIKRSAMVPVLATDIVVEVDPPAFL